MDSEKRTYFDRDSGVEVTQLTGYRGHSHHLYFTNPGWYAGGRRLLFGSDRANRSNLFGVDLATGEIEQLTDLEPLPPPREVTFLRTCVNPSRDEAYVWHGLDLLAIDLESKAARKIHELPPDRVVSMTNCSADGRHVYFGTTEDLSARFDVDLLRGYVGFREYWEARPLSRVVRVPARGGAPEVVHEERCWIGHVNTSPTRSDLLTFCHEGPWDLVDNRIWLLDTGTGRASRPRPTAEGEVVGHEYWYADGERIGYHGGRAGAHFLGRVRFDGEDRVEADFPGRTGHIFSNDERLVVGDGEGVIRLWKREGERYLAPRALCRHGSSMHIQQAHPHPRLSPDGTYVIFTSDRSGYCNVYMAPVPDVEGLPAADGG